MRQEDSLWAPDGGKEGESFPAVGAISTVASRTRPLPRPETQAQARIMTR